MPPWSGQQTAIVVEERAQQIHLTERRSGENIRLRAKRDHLLGGARRVVGKRRVQAIVARQIEPGAVLQKDIDQGPDDVRVAGLFAGDEQTHRVPAIRAERPRVHIGAAGEEDPRQIGAIGRKGRTRPIEAASIRIPGDVMQQRRAREVVVRRLEVGARVAQRVIRGDEIAQSLEVTRIQGVDGFVEAGVRTERRDGVSQLDVVLQPRPRVETGLRAMTSWASASVSVEARTVSGGWPAGNLKRG